MLWLSSLLLLGSVTIFTACNNDDETPTPAEPNTIVDYVLGDDNFSLLRDAVVKAELDGVLSGAGPFTVFAPDNAAFQAFLNAIGTNTIDNTPKEALVAVLTNHVLSGDVKSGDLSTGYFSTLSATGFGDATTSIYINLDGGVTINGTASVTKADVNVDNGVIHVIDEVISLPTIVTFALADPNFSSLVAALTAEGLSANFVDVLSGDGPFTVFAPTNAAFQALLDSNPDWNTIADIPVNVLETVLLYHVTDAGNVRSTDLVDDMMVTTLASGETFTIDLDTATPTIIAGGNTAQIIATDVQAINGVIHAIDTVILPE
ncbi:MAG: fasciclin domain-containing protein [Lewinellaceae bacterium]|nr:fasciclin domain-containing protein [Lewinellaceae bacterium]